MNFQNIFNRSFSSKVKVLLLTSIILVQIQGLLYAASITREYTIKASLIMKITDFIKFPKARTNKTNLLTYDLCTLGKNPFGNIFSQAKAEGIFNKSIVVYENVSNDELNKCGIVFITRENATNLNRVLKILRNTPTLIIGESKGLGKLGAGINFVVKRNRIKFEINRSALKGRGLEISSYLLNIAILVDKEGQ